MRRRFPRLAFGSLLTVGLLAGGAFQACPQAAETEAPVSLSKTRLVLKLHGDERVPVKSKMESNPPTIVLEFPNGRVAGELPEQAKIQRGVIQSLHTTYTGAGDARWIKSVQIELRARYAYGVRSEAGQIVIEIEHPADVAKDAFEVTLGDSMVLGDAAGDFRERLRAMGEAMRSVRSESTVTPASATLMLSSTLQPSAPVWPRALGAGKARAAPARFIGAAKSKPQAPGWLPILFGFATIAGVSGAAWAITRRGVFVARSARSARQPLGLGIVDQLVWKAFEQQGYELVQSLEPSAAGTGLLRIITKNGAKAALQCVNDGIFFEKATVEQFAKSMRGSSVEQGFLVASGSFTVPAQRFAKDNAVTLIGRDQLAELLSAGAMHEQYAKHVKELDGQMEKARETLDEYANQLDMIRRQRNEACWLLGEERAKTSKLEFEREELNQQIRQWQAQTEQWQASAEQNHRRWEDSQWYLGESRAYAEHLESQIRALQDTHGQLEQRLRELGDQIQQAQHERDDSNWFLGESRDAQALLQQQMDEIKQQAGEFQQQMETVRHDLARSQQVLAAERAARQDLEEQLRALREFGERRGATRLSLRDATIELTDPAGASVLKGQLRDVSGRGFGIDCPPGATLPDSAKATFTIPGFDGVFETIGKLVWRRDDESRNRLSAGYEFIDLPAKQRKAIEQLANGKG